MNAMPCHYGTPWLDHFDPPIGTGKGCEACDRAADGKPVQASLFPLQASLFPSAIPPHHELFAVGTPTP